MVWIARTIALAALLAFWSIPLVLAGLPRWTLALPGSLLVLVLVTAAVPMLGRLAGAAGRGSVAVLAWLAGDVRAGLALWRIALAWTGTHLVRLVGGGVRGVRVVTPRAARGLATFAGAAAATARRGGSRTGHAVYSAGSRARASAAPDPARRRRRALQLNSTASRLRRLGRAQEAVARCEHAVAILRSLGDGRSEALTLNNLGLALVHAGDDDRALECYERGLTILRELGDAEAEALVAANVDELREWREAADEPLRRWREGLERSKRRPPRKRKPVARKRARR
jgi:tetratricopeptide (TPR) repeat protein